MTESAEKAYAAFPSDNRYFSNGKRESQDPSWGSEKDLRITVERPRTQQEKALLWKTARPFFPRRRQRATVQELPLFRAYATAGHRQTEPRQVPEDGGPTDSRRKEEERPGGLAAASPPLGTRAAEPKGETPTITKGGPHFPPSFCRGRRTGPPALWWAAGCVPHLGCGELGGIGLTRCTVTGSSTVKNWPMAPGHPRAAAGPRRAILPSDSIPTIARVYATLSHSLTAQTIQKDLKILRKIGACPFRMERD
ncbi:uncharacterized protein LOC142604930 [Balearica regulorum gibbericeps]|uniref:uncharacterized protein LOC142604930 n=1 Tax=Balearica regulorum gibbericeps TaxID=100784 RepID=UPI003F610256